jgi:hypothetical protein
MKRIHLFEFEDQQWFPSSLRNYGTDFLQFLSNKTGMYLPIAPKLADALERSGHKTIIDLASGGGGGLLSLLPVLRQRIPDLTIVFTDYYPNIPALSALTRQMDNVDYMKHSVDARRVPETLTGCRTQFLSFHHFHPEDAQQILQNAIDSNSPIAIFEAQERSITSLVAMMLSPITVWLITPLIRPFSWGRLLFTYLLPVVPLFVCWDGIVSSLRTYSVKEMQAIIDKLNYSDSYRWEVGKVKSGPSKITYLIGTPRVT